MNYDQALAQLRHLYQNMINGYVKDPAEAAKGLLGPAIEALEAADRETLACANCGSLDIATLDGERIQ